MSAEFLTFAHQLADTAGAVIRPYFGAHGTVEEKTDQSPVTLADKLAEAAMRKLIEHTYPDHAIYGEEFGQQLSQRAVNASRSATREPLAAGVSVSEGGASPPSIKNYTWVIDPIDGTRAFIGERKEWGTLIALCADGVPILGILDQPVTGERWVGVVGQPTTYSVIASASEAIHLGHAKEDGLPLAEFTPSHDGAPRNDVIIKTRPCASLADAEFSTTSVHYFTPVQAASIVKLAQSCRATVKDGDCYAYGLLARGMRDIVVDAGLKPYDILALVPIIEGAGGKITGWDGEAVTLQNFKDVVAASIALHNELLSLLN